MGFFNFGKKKDRFTVLHIDDSHWIRIPVSMMLRRHFGARALEAANGLDGIHIAMEEQPDLILLDVMMPQMDGFDTLVRLKNQEKTMAIPVVMCTARDNMREVNTALRLGAVDYITKPIDEIPFVEKIGKILETIAAAKASGVAFPPPTQSMLAVEQVLTTTPSPSPVAPRKTTTRTCPACQQNLEFIEQYKAWYCFACAKYPDF